MSTVAVAMKRGEAAARIKWIVSPSTDLLWFTIGGGAAAYLVWALWRFTHVPLLLIVAVWAIVFDETHGFATISRTYFDSEERAKRGRWLWTSLAFFFAVGPALILVGPALAAPLSVAKTCSSVASPCSPCPASISDNPTRVLRVGFSGSSAAAFSNCCNARSGLWSAI